MAPRARKGWDQLTDRQRDRLIAAGRSGALTGTPGLSPSQSRKYYDSGGSLQSAYGHGPRPRSRYQAPQGATDRIVFGMATDQDLRDLMRWAKRDGPPWFPRDPSTIGIDVLAALSQISRPPTQWKAVSMVYYPNDPVLKGHWVMTVTMKGRNQSQAGPVQEVTILPAAPPQELQATMSNIWANPEALATNRTDRNRIERQWRGVTAVLQLNNGSDVEVIPFRSRGRLASV